MSVHRPGQNLFESAYRARARTGIGLSSASKPERMPTRARRAAETSSRPARSLARPPQWDSQPKLLGTVRNSVYGRAVEPHQPARAFVKRSPKRTANWALAIPPSPGGILHSFRARFKTRKSSFIAASSVGKWPRARTARRSLELSASIAFVTGMMLVALLQPV